MSEYEEKEILPFAVEVVEKNPGITTTGLIAKVIDAMQPNGSDLTNNPSRSDSKISQKVRNLKSHDTLEGAGAVYNPNDGTWKM